MDVFTPEKRSEIMSRVRDRNTKPEMTVRRLLHGLGYRYRLHRRDLPGTPDIAFMGRKKAVFVHGCFWHRHEGCNKASTPKTRVKFWKTKFDENKRRDERKLSALKELGWKTMVVWECEIKDLEGIDAKVTEFLEE